MGWLEGKRVWITGAGSGIGRNLALAAAAAGARLILSGRNLERLQEVADSSVRVARGPGTVEPERPEVVPFDVSDPEARKEAIALVGRRPLNGLINNAGVSQRSAAAETLPEVYRKLLETNLMSAIELTLGVIPLLRSAGGGRIAAVSSIAAELPGPQRSGYSASKAGMNSFFYSLRSELWSEGILVTVVIPGAIRTEVSRNALTEDGGVYGKMDEAQASGMEPDRATARIMAAIEGGKRTCRVGMTPRFRLGLLLKELLPGLFDRIIRTAKVT
ncbi:MAG: SDR family NAD(P)-dependent oxidoreductase [Spirochaetaceae bacterium]